MTRRRRDALSSWPSRYFRFFLAAGDTDRAEDEDQCAVLNSDYKRDSQKDHKGIKGPVSCLTDSPILSENCLERGKVLLGCFFFLFFASICFTNCIDGFMKTVASQRAPQPHSSVQVQVWVFSVL